VKKFRLMPLFLALILSSPAWASDHPKTLKERIKSVSNRSYLKSGRVELTLLPFTSLSLNDAFYQKLGGGLGLAYHFNDAFAIQAMGTYSLNLDTSNATKYSISPTGDVVIPYAGKRTYLFDAGLCWSPIYGKISLAAEWILHFDTYVTAGIGGIGGEIKKGTADASNFGFAGVAGLGARVFFDRTFALKMELKDYMVFTDKVTFKTQERSDVQHQLMVHFGLSIFLGQGSEED
jgi:outer membrane beta-barrel protein